MIKTLLTLLLFCASTLLAQVNFQPYTTKISDITDEIIKIPYNSSITEGITGVIMRTFVADKKTIIASVEVIKKDENALYLSFSPFEDLQQNALPDYSIAPKVGDEVILNFLYGRALAITPDKETYDLVTKSYDQLLWQHPDIFASKLASTYNPTPTKETFQEECIRLNLGLLFFATAEKGHFVDCKSFKILDTISLPQAQSTTLPFYSRVENIKGRVFGLFGGKEIKDYDHYYTNLLKP